MSAPAPPVALQNQCSVIWNNTLYVYSPDAFLSLPLVKGGNWTQEANGVSVVGATCLKGGTDGDHVKTSLYVVGGTANSTSSSYPGLQRYSFQDKIWQTITPVVPVTQHRINHGAAYLNSSSAIVVFAGSQNGQTGASSETFLIEMYPPYRVQAYNALAPPSIRPIMLPWTDEKALMVGGSIPSNKVFTFGAAAGWVDLNVTLPGTLPDPSIAQCSLTSLDDGSRVLQTYVMSQSPNIVTNSVLLNPGGLPAVTNQTVGIPPTTNTSIPLTNTTTNATTSRLNIHKRSVFLNNYPQYNATDAPTITRTGFSLATDDSTGLVAIVGGDTNNSISFFNQYQNSWIAPNQIFGEEPQKPLITTTTSSSIPTSTATATTTPTSSPSPTETVAPADKTNSNRGLILLGAILGAICVLAAILIILLLWLRSIRKRKAKEQQKNNRRRSDYPTDKHSFEEQGLQPLSKAGQPMGISPVPIVELPHEESYAAAGARSPEKSHIRRTSGDSTARAMSPSQARAMSPSHGGSTSTFGLGQGLFKREKSPLVISKPMQPNLGDYQERPAIELGKATPTMPAALNVNSNSPNRKPSNRKTDEGWGKYFQAEPTATAVTATGAAAATTTMITPPLVDTPSIGAQSGHPSPTAPLQGAPSPAARGNNVFWPRSETAGPRLSNKSPKMFLRDSSGIALDTHTVAAGSPNLERGPSMQSKNMAAARPAQARISTASSVNTDGTGYTEDEYEDDPLEPAYASGSSLGPGQTWELGTSPAAGQLWTNPPVTNQYSNANPPPRPLRRPSMGIGPPYLRHSNNLTTLSEEEHSPGDIRTSIPKFPLPGSSIRAVQPSGEHGAAPGVGPASGQSTAQWIMASRKFSEAPVRKDSSARHSRDDSATNSDMSWLQLGGQNKQH